MLKRLLFVVVVVLLALPVIAQDDAEEISVFEFEEAGITLEYPSSWLAESFRSSNVNLYSSGDYFGGGLFEVRVFARIVPASFVERGETLADKLVIESFRSDLEPYELEDMTFPTVRGDDEEFFNTTTFIMMDIPGDDYLFMRVSNAHKPEFMAVLNSIAPVEEEVEAVPTEEAVEEVETVDAVEMATGDITVTLVAVGDQRGDVTGVLRDTAGLSVSQALGLVNSGEGVIVEGVSQETAEALQTALEAVGATVEISGAASGSSSGAAGDGSDESAVEATGGDFTVTLVSVGDDRAAVTAALRDSAGLSTSQVLGLVNSGEGVIVEGVSQETADAIQAALEAVGATVEVSN